MRHLLPSRALFRWFIIALLMVIVPASAAQDEGDDPATLPLLSPGLHLGTMFFGGGYVPEDEQLATAVQDAAAQGMNAFTFYVDWFELEPSLGDYALDDLEASLEWLHSMGIQPMLNLTLIDIGMLNLPPELLNEDGTRLAEGVAFDDPEVVARLNRLLDRIVPLLADHGGFLLLLSNEFDIYFADTPGANPEPFARLIAAAREHVQALVPEMAVGVALTGDEVRQQGPTFQTLKPVTDVIAFNYYPLVTGWRNWLSVLPPDTVAPDLAEIMDAYDGPIVIQEFGCPSAAANDSSPEAQARCFEALFQALTAYDNVRYVTVFTMFDFDEATCDRVVEFFGLKEEDLPDEAFPRWRGYLCTLGLLTPDYEPKPAWDVFLNNLP